LAEAFVETYRVSKTFDAPLDFVYLWCTDFREDDSKMLGEKTRRRFLERTKDRVIWTVAYEEHGRRLEGFRVVWLMPPDAWRLDTCGDGRERGEYRLKPLGKNRTRLDMVFQVTYDTKKEVVPGKEWERGAREEWDTYGKFLEKEFKEAREALPRA
jgi:hypothetical protein